ncbi:MAG: S8 family peptidase [Chloroflexi bacterium]|nr:S8 family peptidase [Chloroflexota bacterium]
MSKQPRVSSRNNAPSSLKTLVLLLLFLAGSIPAAAHATSDGQSKIQPLLLQVATEHPYQKVSIIVQKTTNEPQVESQVVGLGGKITKDLSLIHAFVTELPAKAVLALAQSEQVRWVSLDAPVNQSQTAGATMFTTWATKLGTTNGQSSLQANFGAAPIAAGNYIWFNSNLTVSGLGNAPSIVYLNNATVQFTVDGITYNQAVPDAVIFFLPWATTASTSYDSLTNRWVTMAPMSKIGPIFLAGLTFPVTANLPGNISNVTWQGQFQSDIPGLGINWNWGATVYDKTFSTDYTTLGIKPVSSATSSQYKNSDPVGTPENTKALVIGGACGSPSNYPGLCSASAVTTAYTSFITPNNIFDSALGPNGTYAYGGRTKESFGGFAAEVTPGHIISKVELVLHAYALTSLRNGDDALLTLLVGGKNTSTLPLDHHLFDPHIGADNAGPIYVDITNLRPWRWGDFDQAVEVTLDQKMFQLTSIVGYDAIGLRVTSTLGSDPTGGTAPTLLPKLAVDSSKLLNVYDQVVRAPDVWSEAPAYLQGQGMTVAVVDSGIFKTKNLDKRLIGQVNFNSASHNAADRFGHGTFIADVIGGNGVDSGGKYIGIAPKVNLLNVRISDDQGVSTESDVINALQWIYNNKTKFNIRVVNLSLNSTIKQSYQTSPLNAACELLWFNGIVVVAAAGNSGTAELYPPANDPFVITVGASDDNATVSLADDKIAPFSAYGKIENGLFKPEIVAPGRFIIALLPENKQLTIGVAHPNNRIDGNYFLMSGTSVATAVVSGAVALLLQDEPNLNPDQVKSRLQKTANKNWPGYDAARAGAGTLDIYAAVHSTTTKSANIGIPVSNLLITGPKGIFSSTVNWSSVNWSSVNWSSVNWSSVNWSSVNWSSVNWSSDYWGDDINGMSTAAPQSTTESDAAPATINTPVVGPTGISQNSIFLPIISR